MTLAIERIGMHRFMEESNRIEGIYGDVPEDHVQEGLNLMRISDRETLEEGLKDWVSLIQPDAQFRGTSNVPNVYVSDHTAPPSGPGVKHGFTQLVDAVFHNHAHPYDLHTRYQNLHPFTDGNGRSGRLLTLRHMLWHYPQLSARVRELGWLHMWYYMSLADADRRIPQGC